MFLFFHIFLFIFFMFYVLSVLFVFWCVLCVWAKLPEIKLDDDDDDDAYAFCANKHTLRGAHAQNENNW